MQTMGKVGIGVLVLIALVLGYLLVSKKPNTSESPPTNQTTTNTTPPSGPSYKIPTPSKATLDQLRILATGAGASPTAAQLKNYTDAVSAVAVSSPVLDVTGCKPTPNIFRFTLGRPVMVQNQDSVSHKLTFGPADNVVTLYTAPPNSVNTATINASSAGIVGYACDKTGPLGMFFIDQVKP